MSNTLISKGITRREALKTGSLAFIGTAAFGKVGARSKENWEFTRVKQTFEEVSKTGHVE